MRPDPKVTIFPPSQAHIFAHIVETHRIIHTNTTQPLRGAAQLMTEPPHSSAIRRPPRRAAKLVVEIRAQRRRGSSSHAAQERPHSSLHTDRATWRPLVRIEHDEKHRSSSPIDALPASSRVKTSSKPPTSHAFKNHRAVNPPSARRRRRCRSTRVEFASARANPRPQPAAMQSRFTPIATPDHPQPRIQQSSSSRTLSAPASVTTLSRDNDRRHQDQAGPDNRD